MRNQFSLPVLNGKRIKVLTAGAVCIASLLMSTSAVSAGQTPGSVFTDNNSDLNLWQEEAGECEISSEEMTCYVGSEDAWLDLPVYFVNGVKDVPYVELSDWMDVMVALYQEYLGDEGYGLTLETDDNMAVYERENGYHMLFDFDEDAIYFDDYDSFLHDSSDNSLLDLVTSGAIGSKSEEDLFRRVEKGSYDRFGSEIRLPLADYEIRMFREGDGYYVPLQTLSDFLLALPMQLGALFNGKCVILGNEYSIGNMDDGYTELGELYYSTDADTRSADLAHYSYCELCLALDCLYGQKEIHEIESFDKFFEDTGYKDYLLDTDPVTADVALEEFINYFLDDLHSSFCGYSCQTGTGELDDNMGLANTRFDDLYYRYLETRDEVYKDDLGAYEEVGNTAFITFDEFISFNTCDYYKDIEDIDISEDTIALVIYAHDQINRKNSPIENVVIDLSCNMGGDVDAAAFLLSWCLGRGDLTIKDTLTGAVSTSTYEVDTNLDHKFDETDTITDKNLYCLISPVSFSCGNLVPTSFKNSHVVTLLGRSTGGGSCSVLPLTTASGALFEISSPLRLSSYQNGSSYDIDRSVEPDYYINDIEDYYDREALVEYINGLF